LANLPSSRESALTGSDSGIGFAIWLTSPVLVGPPSTGSHVGIGSAIWLTAPVLVGPYSTGSHADTAVAGRLRAYSET
jgi:hypothetical protein